MPSPPAAALLTEDKPYIAAAGLIITEEGAWPFGAAATVPAAPSNLAATPAGPNRIDLTWDDNATDETGYRVERSPDGAGSWVDVSGTLPADADAYSDTGLVCETEYFYRAVAFNAAGDSPPSNAASATTDACPAPGGNRIGGTGAVRKPPRSAGR